VNNLASVYYDDTSKVELFYLSKFELAVSRTIGHLVVQNLAGMIKAVHVCVHHNLVISPETATWATNLVMHLVTAKTRPAKYLAAVHKAS